jgi:PIN domain nuclease of toxin-antitoxin system
MKLLLDTCTFLWLLTDADAIPAETRAHMAAGSTELWLSAASAWEIAIKHAIGRLALPEPPARLIPAMRARYDIKPLPVHEESALFISKLPILHRDPFDRMIVSQAIVHGLTIITPDPLITQYPAPTLW